MEVGVGVEWAGEHLKKFWDENVWYLREVMMMVSHYTWVKILKLWNLNCGLLQNNNISL